MCHPQKRIANFLISTKDRKGINFEIEEIEERCTKEGTS
jgi:hypothetical protein